MSSQIEEETIKEYISEMFQQYDTENKGVLNFQQLGAFFTDLLKSVGVTTGFNYQTLYEAITMCNPSFSGYATPEEVQKIFAALLAVGQNPRPQVAPVYGYQGQMGGQYVYPQQYMGQAQGQFPQQWGYGGYMNPSWYRQ